MAFAGSLPPSSIHTSHEDGLIDNAICYMLPTDSNIVGNSFEPNVLKNLRRVWVRPSTIRKSHRPLACHTPGGPDVKPFQKFQTQLGQIPRIDCTAALKNMPHAQGDAFSDLIVRESQPEGMRFFEIHCLGIVVVLG